MSETAHSRGTFAAVASAPRRSGVRPGRAARLIVALALCAAGWPATATTYRLMTPSEILLAADLVFFGTVSDVVTESRGGEAWTLVTLRVDELLSGFGYDPAGAAASDDGAGVPTDPAAVAPESVTLAFLGGDAVDSRLLVSGAPTWRFEESFLVAAYEQEGMASPLVGFRQGLWRVIDEGVGGSMIDLDGLALAVADDGSPVRSSVGATTSQVVRAVQAVLAGTLAPVDAAERLGGAGGGEPEQDPAVAPPADEPATPRTVAVTYDVDDSGGPLLLGDKVALAVAAWTESAEGAVNLEATRAQGSTNWVRYGSDDLLGPDTLSLTTVAPGGIVTAYVSPGAGELTHTVLLHEVGVILGVAEGGPGVMATALSTPLTTPADTDIAELVALNTFEPADLTRDGTVDFYDLIALAEAYGAAGVNLAGDLDGDGAVADSDLDLLRERYQFGQPRQPPPAGAP